MQASPFWTFSLQFYRLDGVAPACMALQDQYRVDVNLLLFLLFLGLQRRAVTAADVAEIDQAVAAWRTEAVVPLRSVRRFLRLPPAAIEAAGAQALREKIKAVELEAERLQQEALFALRPTSSWGTAGGTEAAAGNAAAYAAHLGVTFDATALDTLLLGLAGMKPAA